MTTGCYATYGVTTGIHSPTLLYTVWPGPLSPLQELPGAASLQSDTGEDATATPWVLTRRTERLVRSELSLATVTAVPVEDVAGPCVGSWHYGSAQSKIPRRVR